MSAVYIRNHLAGLSDLYRGQNYHILPGGLAGLNDGPDVAHYNAAHHDQKISILTNVIIEQARNLDQQEITALYNNVLSNRAFKISAQPKIAELLDKVRTIVRPYWQAVGVKFLQKTHSSYLELDRKMTGAVAITGGSAATMGFNAEEGDKVENAIYGFLIGLAIVSAINLVVAFASVSADKYL